MTLKCSQQHNCVLFQEVGSHYKAVDYIADLRRTFFPWCRREIRRGPWVWQQDNCTIHKAKTVLDQIADEGVTTSDWPPNSPDISPIENVWKLLQDKVYENGQFTTKDDLLAEIKISARTIDVNVVKNLYSSMRQRLLTVLECKGAHI